MNIKEELEACGIGVDGPMLSAYEDVMEVRALHPLYHSILCIAQGTTETEAYNNLYIKVAGKVLDSLKAESDRLKAESIKLATVISKIKGLHYRQLDL